MKPIVSNLSRRELLQNTGRAAAATALAGMMVPAVHAAEDNTVQLALVGCGGRGTGAAKDALYTKAGPVKLVAMADVFENKLASSYQAIKSQFEDKVDVPEDRKFIGFDGYQKAMDCLKPGDVVIMATPPAFRWVHVQVGDPKGPERLHGEAHYGRRPHDPQDAGVGRRVGAEEPQGGRGPDVPPLRCPPRAVRAHQSRARSATSC